MFPLALVAVVVAATSPEAPLVAGGDPHPLTVRHSPEPGEFHTDNGVSARVLFGASALSHKGTIVGGGVAYERDLFHGIIALELAGEFFVDGADHVFMFEPIVEKPVALTDDITLYFGGGPALVAHVHETGRVAPGWGGLVLWGFEYDLGAGFEVFAELDTALLWVEEPVLEADVGTGVMYRF
jgi:hypothetical protein